VYVHVIFDLGFLGIRKYFVFLNVLVILMVCGDITVYVFGYCRRALEDLGVVCFEGLFFNFNNLDGSHGSH
jgi:hypothetical protein